jgi:hypothetical protein
MKRDYIKDKYGCTYGIFEEDDSRIVAKDKYGTLRGIYDKHSGLTKDKYGAVISQGNMLSALLLTR